MTTAAQWQARADFQGEGLTGEQYRQYAEANQVKRDKAEADQRAAIARNDMFDRGYQVNG